MGVSGERISPDFALCTPRPPCLLPSLAASLTFAEYVGGLFENAPFGYAAMVSARRSCRNSRRSLPAMLQWSHIRRPASMVAHLPPCLNGLTIPSTPHALTNCPATTSAPRKPLFCGLAAPLGTCSAPFVSCHPASREARWWPSCADKMCVAVSHSH